MEIRLTRLEGASVEIDGPAELRQNLDRNFASIDQRFTRIDGDLRKEKLETC